MRRDGCWEPVRIFLRHGLWKKDSYYVKVHQKLNLRVLYIYNDYKYNKAYEYILFIMCFILMWWNLKQFHQIKNKSWILLSSHRNISMVGQQVFLKIITLKFYSVSCSMKLGLKLIKQEVKSYLTSFNTSFFHFIKVSFYLGSSEFSF